MVIFPLAPDQTTFVHCAQMTEDIDTISFCARQPHASSPDRGKNLAHIGRPLPSQILTYCSEVCHVWLCLDRYVHLLSLLAFV